MKSSDIYWSIIRALRMHSSPTIGRGDVHGKRPGFIVYEPYVAFISAEIEREICQPLLERVAFLEAHRNALQAKTTELLTRARAAEQRIKMLESEIRPEIACLTVELSK